MYVENYIIVGVLDNLNPEANYFKDYIFPIASAFFASILGAITAYFTLRHQDIIKIEKEKLDTTNKWTLIAQQVQAELFAFKSNYAPLKTGDPFERIAAIPTILFQPNPVTENFYNLSFLVPIGLQEDKAYSKWSQISKISSIFVNYNQLLELWVIRNAHNEDFKKKISDYYGGKAVGKLTNGEIIKAVGQAFLSSFFDLNEQVISLTDDLILEFGDFLKEFPKYAKSKINSKRLKSYGSVLMVSDEFNAAMSEMEERSAEPYSSDPSEVFKRQ